METKTVTQTKQKEEVEMITISKTEYEQLKKESKKWNDYFYDGVRQIKKGLKNGLKAKKFEPLPLD